MLVKFDGRRWACVWTRQRCHVAPNSYSPVETSRLGQQLHASMHCDPAHTAALDAMLSVTYVIMHEWNANDPGSNLIKCGARWDATLPRVQRQYRRAIRLAWPTLRQRLLKYHVRQSKTSYRTPLRILKGRQLWFTLTEMQHNNT